MPCVPPEAKEAPTGIASPPINTNSFTHQRRGKCSLKAWRMLRSASAQADKAADVAKETGRSNPKALADGANVRDRLGRVAAC